MYTMLRCTLLISPTDHPSAPTLPALPNQPSRSHMSTLKYTLGWHAVQRSSNCALHNTGPATPAQGRAVAACSRLLHKLALTDHDGGYRANSSMSTTSHVHQPPSIVQRGPPDATMRSPSHHRRATRVNSTSTHRHSCCLQALTQLQAQKRQGLGSSGCNPLPCLCKQHQAFCPSKQSPGVQDRTNGLRIMPPHPTRPRPSLTTCQQGQVTVAVLAPHPTQYTVTNRHSKPELPTSLRT